MALSFWKKQAGASLTRRLVAGVLGLLFVALSLFVASTPVRADNEFGARTAPTGPITLRCHCWRGTVSQRTTYCVSMSFTRSDERSCGDFRQAYEYAELARVYRDVVENFNCDNGEIPEGDFRAGTGQPTDRCPSTPAPFNLSQLAAVSLPTIPRENDVAGTVIGNQTRITNGATQQQVDQARQEAARSYNRTFPNPLPGLTLQAAIGGIINIIVGLVGIFFLIVFVWGSFLYMTSAGDPKQVEKGKDAIKGAVIGLLIVMVSYTAVSLLIQTAGTLMGTSVPPVISQENGENQPTRSTTSPRTTEGGDSALTTADGLQACRNWYTGDPALCPVSTCPAGASTVNDLMRIWGAHLPGGNIAPSQAACRSCIDSAVQNLQGRFPALDATCMPVVAGAWNGECSNICIDPNWRTGGQGVGARVDECSPQTYDLTTVTCTRCLAKARQAMASAAAGELGTIRANINAQTGCDGNDQGKMLKWCAYGHPGWAGNETNICIATSL